MCVPNIVHNQWLVWAFIDEPGSYIYIWTYWKVPQYPVGGGLKKKSPIESLSNCVNNLA